MKRFQFLPFLSVLVALSAGVSFAQASSLQQTDPCPKCLKVYGSGTSGGRSGPSGRPVPPSTRVIVEFKHYGRGILNQVAEKVDSLILREISSKAATEYQRLDWGMNDEFSVCLGLRNNAYAEKILQEILSLAAIDPADSSPARVTAARFGSCGDMKNPARSFDPNQAGDLALLTSSDWSLTDEIYPSGTDTAQVYRSNLWQLPPSEHGRAGMRFLADGTFSELLVSPAGPREVKGRWEVVGYDVFVSFPNEELENFTLRILRLEDTSLIVIRY